MSMQHKPTSRHRRILKTAMSALLVTLLPLSEVAAEEAPVKIAVEGGFPPFNYLDADNKLQGFDVEVANALCVAEGIKCEFIVHKWDSIIPDLLAGNYDVILSSMSMSAERRKKVAFSQKYYDSPSVFIAAKGSMITNTKPETLKGLHIGVTYDTAQASYVDKFYGSTADISVFPNSPDLYKALAEGKVDIIMEDKLAVYDWLANTKAGQCCAFAGPDIRDITYFGEGAGIAFRPADNKLRARFDAALEKIKSDGSYDMINAKYFPFSIN